MAAAYGAVTASRTRTAVAAVTAGSLVAGTAWAVVERDEIVAALSGDAGRCDVDSARTQELAFELAALCDKNIEIEALRTEYDTSWATPRGTVLADSSAGAVRTDIDGSWQDTDPSIRVDEATGVPEVAAPVFEIGLTGGDSGGELVSMGRDDLRVAMGLPFGLGTPVVDEADDSRVVYPALDDAGGELVGVDVVVRVHPDGTGVTPVVRVADQAAADRLLDVTGEEGLAFTVEASGGLELTDIEPVDEETADWDEPLHEEGTDSGAGAVEKTSGDSDAAARSAAAAASAADSTDPEPQPVEGTFFAVDSAGSAVFSGGIALQWDSAAGGDPQAAGSDTSDSGTTAEAQKAGSATRSLADGGGVAESTSTSAATPTDAPAGNPGLEETGERVEAPMPGDAVTVMDVEVDPDGSAATVSADLGMLTAESTTFPVFIDPPLSGNRNAWTNIKKAWPSSNSAWKFSGTAGMGYCDVSIEPVCQRSGNVQRLLWWFTGLGDIGRMEASDVVSATFRAKGTHSYSCEKWTVELWKIAKPTSSTTWSNHVGNGGWKSKVSQVADAYYSSACGGTHTTEWDATSVAKTIASGDYSTAALGLKAATETDMRGWKRYAYSATLQVEYNRAPKAPFGHRTIVDGSNIGCGTSAEPDYSNWLRPTMRVVADDVDDSRVSVQFVVIDVAAGTRPYESAWQSFKKPGSTGAEFTLRVPEGEELTSGRTYRWRAQVKDDGGRVVPYSDTRACYFVVDNTAPKPPVVTPLRDHPEAQAFYESDQERGGVGLRGCWEVYSPSTDATTLWWGYSTRTNLTKVTLGSSRRTQVCHTPGAAGEKFLYAKVADAAGHSAKTEYEFKVATAREDGVWTFDDPDARGADTSLLDPDRDEFAPAGDLNFKEDTQFAMGPHAEFGARDDDEALVARAAKMAWTDAPVIDTTGSFVVSAHVRLDEDTSPTGWYTAISQDGTQYNGFRLGYNPRYCPDVDPCWGFGVNRELDASSIVHARSTVPAKIGEWVHLLGEYDKPAGKVRLYVCEVGTPEEPAVAEPRLYDADYVGDLPQAAGKFAIGRGLSGGAFTHYWNGQIDNVRIFRGEVLAAAKIRRLCQGAEANQMAGGVDDVDPTWPGNSGQEVAP
ncbi:LamG domain-containing protein [Myceligenerans pegani]|uniref:LamG domain-containing protein n=1 Tax=Myceligenerans pegani TaxID=2776917 RepID=A0ABR9MX88_9MICO|nr:LamG domain-containing protein [Myceligenerans sp. TRM 65318]MBE1875987.1 LamG domain-containing protein [Myceligenerans sp. TRM 65318]MBE3018258.1 LamG domain-containing protein [Myceligenerans sp. TRM 65318]